jgi:uncharacterized protein Usg
LALAARLCVLTVAEPLLTDVCQAARALAIAKDERRFEQLVERTGARYAAAVSLDLAGRMLAEPRCNEIAQALGTSTLSHGFKFLLRWQRQSLRILKYRPDRPDNRHLHLLNFHAVKSLPNCITLIEVKMASKDLQKRVAGYGLTTANILYRRPDHSWLLQTFVWQAYDVCPAFPELQRFLNFWRDSLEGDLHSVTVAHSNMIKPAELAAVHGVLRLH